MRSDLRGSSDFKMYGREHMRAMHTEFTVSWGWESLSSSFLAAEREGALALLLCESESV